MPHEIFCYRVIRVIFAPRTLSILLLCLLPRPALTCNDEGPDCNITAVANITQTEAEPDGHPLKLQKHESVDLAVTVKSTSGGHYIHVKIDPNAASIWRKNESLAEKVHDIREELIRFKNLQIVIAVVCIFCLIGVVVLIYLVWLTCCDCVRTSSGYSCRICVCMDEMKQDISEKGCCKSFIRFLSCKFGFNTTSFYDLSRGQFKSWEKKYSPSSSVQFISDEELTSDEEQLLLSKDGRNAPYSYLDGEQSEESPVAIYSECGDAHGIPGTAGTPGTCGTPGVCVIPLKCPFHTLLDQQRTKNTANSIAISGDQESMAEDDTEEER